MEWEENESASDLENERQQNTLSPEVAWNGRSTAGVDDSPTSNVSISQEERDTTESSSDDEDSVNFEKLPLVAIHAKYHMPIPVDQAMDSFSDDSNSYEDEPGRIKRGFQSDCAFCQCSLLGFVEPPPEPTEAPSATDASYSSLSSSPAHSGDDEPLEDYLGDYFEDMDLEEDRDFSVLEGVNVRFHYKINLTVSLNSLTVVDSRAIMPRREDI